MSTSNLSDEQRTPDNRVFLEASRAMSESAERTAIVPRSNTPHQGGVEEEEPPGKRRHPLWRDVPDSQWDDWRWQSQNAVRSVRQLRNLLSFTPGELEAIGSLEAEY